MNRYKYICWSKTGMAQRGLGETTLELGSDELNRILLNEIAQTVTGLGIPWDPFNIELVVRAQDGPKQIHIS